jgi:hypothetical protein
LWAAQKDHSKVVCWADRKAFVKAVSKADLRVAKKGEHLVVRKAQHSVGQWVSHWVVRMVESTAGNWAEHWVDKMAAAKVLWMAVWRAEMTVDMKAELKVVLSVDESVVVWAAHLVVKKVCLRAEKRAFARADSKEVLLVAWKVSLMAVLKAGYSDERSVAA